MFLFMGLVMILVQGIHTHNTHTHKHFYTSTIHHTHPFILFVCEQGAMCVEDHQVQRRRPHYL